MIILKIIDEMEITDTTKLKLSIGEFRGAERVDLRQFYKVENEYIPTKKGINFNSEWIDDFLKMVNKLKDI